MSLDEQFLNNTLLEWFIALGLAVIIFIFLEIVKSLFQNKLAKLAKKTKTDIDDLFVRVLKRTKFFFFLVSALFIAGSLLDLPKTIGNILYSLFIFKIFATLLAIYTASEGESPKVYDNIFTFNLFSKYNSTLESNPPEFPIP